MSETEHIYRVNEIFYSLQGEGYHTGTPAVFLRFSGCNLRCPFCDTDFSYSEPMTLPRIMEAVTAFPARHIVLTGGEPLLQADHHLLSALKEAGFYIQTETNGTVPAPDLIDWVTCSPKLPESKAGRADELKIVFQGQDVESIASGFSTENLFLQPCSGENIKETMDYILAHPHWRLSLQTHKILDIR